MNYPQMPPASPDATVAAPVLLPLDSKVTVISGSYAGKKGTVVVLYSKKYNSTDYTIALDNGSSVNVSASQVKAIKTATLYAYSDTKSEIHWATLQYSDTALKELKYMATPEYNKTVDIE